MEKLNVKNAYSKSFIWLGIWNVIGYLFPFIMFDGLISAPVSGYELFSWFKSPYDEGPFFASTSVIIFFVAMLMLTFGGVSLYLNENLEKPFNKTIAYILAFLFILCNAIGLPILIKYTQAMVSKYIFALQTPTAGVGGIVLFSINIIASILIVILLSVKKESKQE